MGNFKDGRTKVWETKNGGHQIVAEEGKLEEAQNEKSLGGQEVKGAPFASASH